MAVGAGLTVLVLIGGLYVARNLIAREFLLNWLRARGVEAEADLSGLGLGGVAGRVVAGPRGDPDLTVEHAEVAYGLTGFWNNQPLGLQVTSLRLVRPVVKAQLKAGKLSFGVLDPIVEEFSRRPPRPGARQPMIQVESGRLRLATDYGPADVRADALMDDGRLLRLDARLAQTHLAIGQTAADVGGQMRLRSRGDRLDMLVDAGVLRLTSPGLQAEGARLRLSGRAPYPDFALRRVDGVISLRLEGSAARLAAAGGRYDEARFATTLSGRSAGWIDRLSFSGAASGDIAARRLALGAAFADDLRAHVVAQTFAVRPTGDRLTADLNVTGDAKAFTQGALRLKAVRAGFHGAGALGGADGPRVKGVGAFSADGQVAGLPASRDEPAEARAVKRALANFQVAAPGLRVGAARGDLTLSLVEPVRATSAGGGGAAVTARAGRPVFAAGRGVFDLAIAGGGLPKAEVAVNGLTFARGRVAAPLSFSVRTNFDPIRDGVVRGDGVLVIGGEAVQLTTRGCLDITADHLEFGENDVLKPHGRFCPADGPLFRYADGNWRVRGRAAQAGAEVPLMQSAVRDASGPVSFSSMGGAFGAEANIERARLEDAAPQRRFNPIFLSGPALLREGVWQAAVVGSDAAGRRLGEAQVSHDVQSGVGEADIDTGALTFAEGGLQPAALSPLAASLGPPARGQAGFTGNVAWSPDGVTSRGLLTIRSLDFTSPMGAVSGLKGEVSFTGLAPLEAAAGQRLRADSVAGFAPMTNVQVDFGLGGEQIRVEGGQAAIGGGTVKLEPFAVPFAPGATWGGAIRLEGVQIAPMVEATPFGDRVDLDARLSGRIPFQSTPLGVRIAAGDLHAIAPGRLSIQRQALTGVATTGGAPVAPGAPAPAATPTNAFSDFAYQAMENLAFDTLSARIDSLPGGRLGVVFHIKGRNEPPKKQILRVPVDQLVDRSFMDRPQLLPSGTRVDLTLDTSLNLDQLLDDFTGYQQLHNSAEVQAKGPIKAPSSAERTQ